MKYDLYRARGFTLIETLIVIFVFSLVILAIMNLYLRSVSFAADQQAIIRVSGGASEIMKEVELYTRQADAVVSSHSFSGTLYTSGVSTLVLELPSITSAGGIVSGSHDYVAFYKSGNHVYRILAVGAGDGRISGTHHLSDVLNTLTFTYDNASIPQSTSVGADVTTHLVANQHTWDSHLNEQIYLRNL